MNVARTLLAAVSLFTLSLAVVPTADALACPSLGPTGTGPIGTTLEYVDNTQQYLCSSTSAYVVEMCLYVFAPGICYSIA